MTDTARPIRTFHPRRGRMSARHADAHAALWPRYGLTVVDGDRTPLSLAELFGRDAPKILEIGFGMGDAMELVHRLAPDSLDAVHVFFPDPWPKARHHKRRLIQPGNVVLLRERLRVGGVLHCATDWPEYAEAMNETLAGDPFLRADAPTPHGRPETKFERRGAEAGRPITDLRFAKI